MDSRCDHIQLYRGKQIELLANNIQAFGAHLDLFNRLFPGYIEDRTAIFGNGARYLQKERGFSNAWLAADQDQRARDESATEYAVHLCKANRDAGLHQWFDVWEYDRDLRALRRRGLAQQRLPTLLGRTLWYFSSLFKGVPCAAIGAFPHPFAVFPAALLANVFC